MPTTDKRKALARILNGRRGPALVELIGQARAELAARRRVVFVHPGELPRYSIVEWRGAAWNGNFEQSEEVEATEAEALKVREAGAVWVDLAWIKSPS